MHAQFEEAICKNLIEKHIGKTKFFTKNLIFSNPFDAMSPPSTKFTRTWFALSFQHEMKLLKHSKSYQSDKNHTRERSLRGYQRNSKSFEMFTLLT